MIERRQRIPADEVVDPKSWNLPFWVEPEALVKAREKELAKEQLEAEVEVEEEEIEVEPLTADQLEQIRQEAYNEGLEQGLVEGRQKGEKLGAQEGHKEGLAAGTEEGRKLGFEAGNSEGKKQAQESGDQQTQQTIEQLESVIHSLSDQLSAQKNDIENLLPELVEMLAQAVIHEELSQGSEHIVALVKLAIDALPLDKSHLIIELNEQDLPFLEASFEQNNIEAKLNTNNSISPGGCQLITDKSVADFTLESRWAQVIKQYKSQLEVGLLQTPNEPEADSEDLKTEPKNENDSASQETTEANPATASLEAEGSSKADNLKTDNPTNNSADTSIDDNSVEAAQGTGIDTKASGQPDPQPDSTTDKASSDTPTDSENE